jgi:predicted nucleic acid-binding OB-fold protein
MTDLKIATPVLTKRGLEGIPEGLPLEEVERLQKLQAKLNDFLLHLIQAFLRTGYYTPDHPESARAKEGLYQQFKTLFEVEDELSFLVREEQEQREILVEGLLPEAQRLSRMMMKGMGELYVPKFAQYLERKDLISLTLKSRMGQTEFTRFVDLMSDPSLIDTRRKQDKERFTQALLSRGIFNISFIFNEELLAPDREMPWRARVALSRMRKDLKMTPIFQKMMRQDLHDIRRNLLQDVLRPNRQSDLLCAILRNSDLATTPESREENIENEIIAFLQKQYLLGTSKLFLQEHIALKQLKKGDAFEKKSDRLTKKISHRLKEVGTKEAENLLEEFFRNQFIGLEDLTPALKNKILLERLTDKFLSYTDQFFLQLDQATEKEKFLNVSISFVKIIPELIRRDRYPEILRILQTLKRHFHEKRMWALLAGQILEEIGKGTIPLLLQEKFLTGKKETRIAIVPIFVSLEVGAIPPLLTILKTSEDQWVRKNACESLIQIGPVAAVHLLKELSQQETSVETTRDILRVLGEIKSREWKAPLMEILRRYTSHENPQLKEQALHTLCQVGGSGGEEIFLSSLSDPDLDVQKRAIWCLGMIKSTRGIEKMMGILKQISITPSLQLDKLETQIYYVFGLSGNLTIEGKTLEQILIEAVEKRGIKGLLGFLQKNPLSDASLMAICDTLGKVGTNESVKVLTKLEKSVKGPLIPKVKEALEKIGERTALSKTQR